MKTRGYDNKTLKIPTYFHYNGNEKKINRKSPQFFIKHRKGKEYSRKQHQHIQYFIGTSCAVYYIFIAFGKYEVVNKIQYIDTGIDNYNPFYCFVYAWKWFWVFKKWL